MYLIISIANKCAVLLSIVTKLLLTIICMVFTITFNDTASDSFIFLEAISSLSLR